MKIQGSFKPRARGIAHAPYVAASITLPRFDVRGSLDLLIDTGSDATILQPSFWRPLELDITTLTPTDGVKTLNGMMPAFTEDAEIAFQVGNHPPVVVPIKVLIANPPEGKEWRASTLGRDVLQAFTLTVCGRRQLVTLERPD